MRCRVSPTTSCSRPPVASSYCSLSSLSHCCACHREPKLPYYCRLCALNVCIGFTGPAIASPSFSPELLRIEGMFSSAGVDYLGDRMRGRSLPRGEAGGKAGERVRGSIPPAVYVLRVRATAMRDAVLYNEDGDAHARLRRRSRQRRHRPRRHCLAICSSRQCTL